MSTSGRKKSPLTRVVRLDSVATTRAPQRRHDPQPGQTGGEGQFASRLIDWQRRHGRNDLPWQQSRDPYTVWLSEIMLQQTQVTTVIPYYTRFLQRFPDLQALAVADLDDVLRLWSGLGYYSRARNLHRAAREIVGHCNGRFPSARWELEALPGIGRSTAAAIAVFSFAGKEAILDGNVKRVLARHFAVSGFPGEKAVQDRLWSIAEALLPAKNIERYTQALMDLGATVCTRKPECRSCPLRESCLAYKGDAVALYPESRRRKANPLRKTRMLILTHRGRVLLVRRPPVGIWPGLWSFPEAPEEVPGNSSCVDMLGIEIGKTEELPVMRHAFTHFSLDIMPTLCTVSGRKPVLRSDESRWVKWDEVADWALPAPVRRLLKRLSPPPQQRGSS